MWFRIFNISENTYSAKNLLLSRYKELTIHHVCKMYGFMFTQRTSE